MKPSRKVREIENTAEVIDLSKRRATQEMESKYRVLFDQASDAIMTVTSEDQIDEVNEAFEELTGYHKSEIESQSLSLLIPDPKKNHIPERTRVISPEFLISAGTYDDVAILRKDGYVRLVDLSVRAVKKGSTSLYIALLRDVTEKKRMERELITKHSELRNAYMQLERSNLELKSTHDNLVQAGKMAALGELTAGIAHELNQPLQSVRGYAQELQETALPLLAQNPKIGELQLGLKEIIANVDKMAKIIHHLRSFTSKSVEDHEMLDIHFVIEEALKMLSRQFVSRGIQVHRDFKNNLPKMYANPVQLEQVFINLATNARDAIEATGRGNGNVWIQTCAKGKFIEVLFKDDGMGMSNKTKSKAFNPFFTTKEVGKGMGLGLSLSYGILNKIHGSIVVESELGKGAAFLVRLPQDFREID